MVEAREGESVFESLPARELLDHFQEAKDRSTDEALSEANRQAAGQDLEAINKQLDERYSGLLETVEDLGYLGSEVTKKDIVEAKRVLRRKIRDPAKQKEALEALAQFVEQLEKRVAKEMEEVLRLSGEDLKLPEPPKEVKGRSMKNARKGKDLPKVYLSQLFTTLKDVDLPSKMVTREVETEEGIMALRFRAVTNVREAVKAGLFELHRMITTKKDPFNSIERASIRYYVDLVEEMIRLNKGDKKIYTDFSNVTENTFRLFNVAYREWNQWKGRKHEGVKEILSGVSRELDTQLLYDFLQDPEIESAAHRIKGQVSEKWFQDGSPDRGELGNVLGGDYGAVEKIGWYLASVAYLRSFDGYEAVMANNYNAHVVRYLIDYYKKGYYENFFRLINAICLYQKEGRTVPFRGTTLHPKILETLKKGDKVLRTHFDYLPWPTLLHGPLTVDFILDNFTKEKLGWKNLARMLVFYGEYDPRYEAQQALAEAGPRRGYYTLEDWFFADETRQRRMYQVALRRFKDLPGEEQKRIMRHNILTTYDFAEVVVEKDKNKIKWHTKPLLDFDETDKDGNYLVDMGALSSDLEAAKLQGWGGGLSADIFNKFMTAEEYVMRFFDIMDKLYDPSVPEEQRRFENVLRTLTASEGLRHLTEKMDELDLPREYAVERSRRIDFVFSVFSNMWLERAWSDRRDGRRETKGEWFGWEKKMNQLLVLGLEAEAFKKEFKAIGEFMDYRDAWQKARQYTTAARVAKILGRFEHKDAWIAYLKGVAGLDKELTRVLFGPNFSLDSNYDRIRLFQWAEEKGLLRDLREQERKGRTWTFYPDSVRMKTRKGWLKGGWDLAKMLVTRPKPVEPRIVRFNEASASDRARIILDELTYRTIVYYAGFDIDKEFLEYDWYGYPRWRTWFNLDFNRREGVERGDGEGRKLLFPDEDQWQEIKYYLERKPFVKGGKEYVGALDDPFYSPFSIMYEKMDEDKVRWGIAEYYMRQSFDKTISKDISKSNYVWPHRWRGVAKKDLKRWREYTWMLRQQRYTVGELKGRYPISQPVIEYDPNTGLPLFEDAETDKIFKMRKMAEQWWLYDPETGEAVIGTDGLPARVEFDEVTGLPKNTDPECWRVRLQHVGDPPLPKIAFRGYGFLSGHDQLDSMVWGTEGIWSTRKDNRGHGWADMVERLTFEPFCYDKNVNLAFVKARYFDARYAFERALNIGEEAEAHQVALHTGDEAQRAAFYKGLEREEDAEWAKEEAFRDGCDVAVVQEYEEVRKELLMPEVGEVKVDDKDEEGLINLRGLTVEFLPPEVAKGIAALIPRFKSKTERNYFIRAVLIGEVPASFLTVRALISSDPLAAILTFLASQAVPFVFANAMRDRGVDKKGREKVGGFVRALQSGFGLDVITGKDINLGLGMFGARKKARHLINLACGYEPVHTGAIKDQLLDALLDYWFFRRKKEMVRTSPGY